MFNMMFDPMTELKFVGCNLIYKNLHKNVREFPKIFGNVRVTLGQLSENLRKSSEKCQKRLATTTPRTTPSKKLISILQAKFAII